MGQFRRLPGVLKSLRLGDSRATDGSRPLSDRSATLRAASRLGTAILTFLMRWFSTDAVAKGGGRRG
jgi:hypothetical protein